MQNTSNPKDGNIKSYQHNFTKILGQQGFNAILIPGTDYPTATKRLRAKSSVSKKL